MSDFTTEPGDELDLHKIESAVKLYYGYTGAYTRHLLKEWHAEELRQAKEQAWDEGHEDGAWNTHNALAIERLIKPKIINPYRSQK